jgi:putative ABC transport system permease protein
MNIINKLTIRHLKQNKKRTIFTLFSIILSIIMINCIGISLYSFQTYYKKTIEKDIGSFHYQITTSISEAIDIVENDNEIKYFYFTKTNYVLYNDMSISVKNCDETYYQKKNTKDLLYKGSLPDNSNEIALMKDYGKNIGDTITLKYEDKAKTYTVVGIIKEHTNKSTFDSEYQAITYIDLTENDYITITI